MGKPHAGKRLVQLEVQGELLTQVDEFAGLLGSTRVSAIRKLLVVGLRTMARDPSLAALAPAPAVKTGEPETRRVAESYFGAPGSVAARGNAVHA